MVAGDVSVNITKNNAKKCLHFDGVDDYVESAAFSISKPSYVTWCLWAKSKTATTDHQEGILYKHIQYEIFWNVNGQLYVYMNTTNEGWHLAVRSNAIIDFDVWHHIAITYDGAEAKIYVDGVENVLQQYATTGEIVENSFYLRLGYASGAGDRYWNGQIADIRLYSCLLTAAHLTTLANGDDIQITPTLKWTFKNNDYSADIGGITFTNYGTAIKIIDSDISAVINGARTTANDKYMLVGLVGGQILSTVIEEA